MRGCARTCASAKVGLHLCECGAKSCVVAEFRKLQTPEGRKAAMEDYRKELSERAAVLEKWRAKEREKEAAEHNTRAALALVGGRR